MTKFLCGECIHNSDKGGGCLIPKNLGYVDNCNHYLPKDRPIAQTNEEYIHSLNTEQLAEILLAIYQDGIDDCKQEWWKDTKEDFVEWLKQPHTDKE